MLNPWGFNAYRGIRTAHRVDNTMMFANPDRTKYPNHFQELIMGQSLVKIYVHVVFSTKSRKPFLKSDVQRERLHSYLSGICKNQKSPAIIVGGVEDHVHLLCRLGKTIDIANLIRNLKSDSSGWVKEELAIPDFYWQTGYGAFSVSPSHVDALTNYIANQEEHHRTESFQAEFRRLCEKYGLEIDERYVWE